MFILDQTSDRFVATPRRPLYAGLIGVLVCLGWFLLIERWSVSQFDPASLIFPAACFLSGATFAKIVTFPRPEEFVRALNTPRSR